MSHRSKRDFPPDPPKRGRCAACGFRFRLTKDGKVYSHILYTFRSFVCDGSGLPPVPGWGPRK